MKSHESSLLDLWISSYYDAFQKCIAAVPSKRDIDTLISRVEHEGLSFFTITLPDFGKDFDKSLLKEEIDPTFFRSFKKNGSIPAFLQGMIGQVFNRTSGKLNPLETIDISLIEGVRQLSYMFKKLKLPCSEQRTAAALQRFILIERQDLATEPDEMLVNKFHDVSTLLWKDLSSIDYYEGIPKHGPGSTAERILGNKKYVWKYWYERLDEYFPFYEYGYFVSSACEKESSKVTFISSHDEKPVRVIPVPKTAKSPRIIAIEPCCMQYAQQALGKLVISFLESSRYTCGHVNFRDQSINQKLALKSSFDKSYSTLDLSDASDRVYRSLAEHMFQSNPELWAAIDSCRSRNAKVGKEVIPLSKFASMGSALCFPIESMYFYTICVAALLEKYRYPLTSYNLQKVCKEVYVYGDDIIVPTHSAIFVADYLQKYNCKVNTAKSCWNGSFRESCGMDAFNGISVTPTYVRELLPSSKRQAKQVVSTVATRNQFYLRGYWRTASFLDDRMSSIIGELPVIDETSSLLGRISFLRKRTVHRYNTQLHRFEVFGWSGESTYRSDKLRGYGALMKCLVGISQSECETNKDHLERSVRRGSLTLKRRWVAA